MWLSFWRSRDRFSLAELRYLTDQLLKVQIVNDVNKDFIIEALRSIAELITYGDQHDPSFFDFFMEKQVMGEFVRVLKISKTVSVPLQLLQTISIMIQNLKSEHAIYYMFSNEHINSLITYSFDFNNEELLSYYISFLRAISGKLNKNTISLLVKTQNDEVFSFPLYVKAIQFAFHEESMIRTAIRTLTLNVFHVGDEGVNKYVCSNPHSDYFLKLVLFFRNQCISLNNLVADTSKNPGVESSRTMLTAVDEIEDNLYYYNDVISAGIPDVGRLITDNILQHLILPLLLPSLRNKTVDDPPIGAVTSLYLLCCILRILKIKDLANTVAAALFVPLEAFIASSDGKVNGCISHQGVTDEQKQPDNQMTITEVDLSNLSASTPPNESGSIKTHPDTILQCDTPLREVLLSFVSNGDDDQVLGSLSVLSTLLQTKELDESMLDELGILPQRKQHKKLLLQALVGEGSGEARLFSSGNSSIRDGIGNELQFYLQNLKDKHALVFPSPVVGTSSRVQHRFQVLDALVSLFCRSNISADTLWDGGWLLRQLLPYSKSAFNINHLELLKNAYEDCTSRLLREVKGVWPDLLLSALSEEWKKCKRAIESSSPRKELKSILSPSLKCSFEEADPRESSFNAGKRMLELVKVFVLLKQLQLFCLGRALPEQPPIHPPINLTENSRGKTSGLDALDPRPGTELRLVDAVPCRIAFEPGKERHFSLLPVSLGTTGWIVLAEKLPLKPHYGVVRVTAPLAGCNARINEKHSRWLHLRIRPSSFPLMDFVKSSGNRKVKNKTSVDGKWILAFKDEESCKKALSIIQEEINLQCSEVERRLAPLLDLGKPVSSEVSSSSMQSSNDLGKPVSSEVSSSSMQSSNDLGKPVSSEVSSSSTQSSNYFVS